ncbi:MAG: hypothetical protein RLZZ553_246 [Verrucomicrobiota bacterium]|jgi:bacterioferritin-associated ferredoxin
MKVSHLVLLPKKETESGSVEISSQLRLAGHRPTEFFFRLPKGIYDSRMEVNANHHLLAMLMPAMRVGGRLKIAGVVDPMLLKNLNQYMHYWIRWCPDRLKILEIEADGYQTMRSASEPAMISCFSGGVDSMYSFLRAEKDLGTPLKTLLFLHGFDIDIKRREYSEKLVTQYRAWLQARSSRVNLISLVTNAREISDKFQLKWGRMAHGIYLAACMHLFSHQHTLGCIASSDSPSTLIYPWGSTPVTDPLLSTSALSMHHHDCMVTRFEKIQELVKNPDCCSLLRVCYRIDGQEANCGRCGKCLRSLIAMHVAEPDSWREAFPSVKNFDGVMDQISRMRFDRWMIEQLDDARNFALRRCETSHACELNALIENKHQGVRSVKNQLSRLFYDAKVRLYSRYPSLIKKS